MTTTVRLLATYDGSPPQTIRDLPDALAAFFVAQGNASLDLTGGVAYVPYVAPDTYESAKIRKTPVGTVVGITDGNGAPVAAAGGGASDIPFALAIPLTSGGSAYMPQQNITGPMTFTLAPNPVKNSLVYARLVGNGVDTPNNAAFKEWGGSLGFDKTLGIVNQVQWFYDGYDPYVSYAQVIGATAIDTTAPTVSAAAVANATPTVVNITFNEALAAGSVPAASAVTVSGHTVQSVAVSGSNLNVTVTPAFVNGEAARTAAYTQPGTNGLRDAAGNQVASFTNRAITNNVAATDTTAPALQSAAVNGAALVVAYNEALNTASPALSSFSYVLNGAAAVNPTAAVISGVNVTLTFAVAATNGQAATLSYTPGTNPIRDTAGNAAASFSAVAVTNNTPASDVTAPVIQSAAMNGTSLVMTYNEALTANSPTLASLSLAVDGGAGVSPTAATASGTTVTLTFATPVTSGQTLALTYTAGATAIKDAAGNNAANLTAYSVTNNTSAVSERLINTRLLTEGGSAGAYTYTGAGAAFNSATNTDGAGVLNLAFQSGVDGSFSLVSTVTPVASTGPEIVLGVDISNTVGTYATLDYCMVNHPTAYAMFVNGTGGAADTAVAGAANDVMGVVRTGSTLVFRVSKNGGATWTTIKTYTGVSTGVLYVHAKFAFASNATTLTSTGLA